MEHYSPSIEQSSAEKSNIPNLEKHDKWVAERLSKSAMCYISGDISNGEKYMEEAIRFAYLSDDFVHPEEIKYITSLGQKTPNESKVQSLGTVESPEVVEVKQRAENIQEEIEHKILTIIEMRKIIEEMQKSVIDDMKHALKAA